MCRLLYISCIQPIALSVNLAAFAETSRTSPRWQGDGWGIVFKNADGEWQSYKSLESIWNEQTVFSALPATRFALSHVRGAFGVNTKKLENTHPFQSGKWWFAFNGNIQGMKMRVPGSIGAKKIFNLVLNELEISKPEDALCNVADEIARNSRYIVGLNCILTDGEKTYVYCRWGEREDEDYYAIRYYKSGDLTIVCSREYGEYPFERMKSGEVKVF
ncbi:MAG: class II glutamine amidotransferase [bacterium]